MFEELGLNVARQEDNGANPRPDNRSGWLEGEPPATPIDDLVDSAGRGELLGSLDAASAAQARASPRAYPPRPPQEDAAGRRRRLGRLSSEARGR